MSETTATSTVAEIEARLKELELKYLGPPSEISGPFAPVSAHRSRVERFNFSAENTLPTQGSDKRDFKLPGMPSYRPLTAKTLTSFSRTGKDG